MMSNPSLQIMSIRQMGKGKYGVRVNFSDFIKSDNYDYYYSMDDYLSDNNYHLEGDFSLDLLINGVQVKWIDLKFLPDYVAIRDLGNSFFHLLPKWGNLYGISR